MINGAPKPQTLNPKRSETSSCKVSQKEGTAGYRKGHSAERDWPNPDRSTPILSLFSLGADGTEALKKKEKKTSILSHCFFMKSGLRISKSSQTQRAFEFRPLLKPSPSNRMLELGV